MSPRIISNHLILCCPFVLWPSIFPSIRVFSNELALCIRRPNYWSFSISTSKEYSELISFRIDWFALLAVQGILKTLLQHHNLKALVHRLPFFIVQLSHPYMTTGKTIALTIWTFVSKVMFLLFNTLSRFVIAFLSRSEASFNFMTAVTICSDFWAQENKICHCFHFLFFCLPWSDGTEYTLTMGLHAKILGFECWVLIQFFHSPVSPSSRSSIVPLLSAIRVVSSAYLTLLMFLLAILFPACDSSSLAFCMNYSA